MFKPETLNLIDPFTYCNSNRTKVFTCGNARLDRFYVSDFISSSVSKYTTLNNIADHKMIKIEIDIDDFKLWGNFYWKINNYYMNDQYYKAEIENLINRFNERKSSHHILDNWEIFKNEVKNSSKSFAKFKATERKNIQIICNDLRNRDPDIETLENIEREEELIKDFINRGNLIRSKNEALNKLYKEGKEISRKEEIKNGNAKFIHQIKKEDQSITNKEDIINEVHNYYQNLYTSQLIDDDEIDDYLNDCKPPQLLNEDKIALDDFINSEEVFDAIDDLILDKSPGDDGLTSEFYKAFKSQLNTILAEVYNNIYITNNLVPTMKNGIIQLIYKKKGNQTELKFWRPISLLNVDYKILTKILSKRLKNSINYLINPYQSSGVKEREILDNVLNIKNIINYVKDKNMPTAIISLDNEKAFDRIEINYLIKVLQKYDFPETFLKWIEIIYKDITSQVLVNGALTPKIQIQRSVRQGCPLSMLLYIFCIEPLIYKINNNPRIVGLKIPNCSEPIKTIQHVDDMTVIITTDRSYVNLEIENKKFSSVSGSKINMDKTEVITFGNFDTIPHCYIKSNIKVLGCYFGNDENQNFRQALGKMERIIKNWKFLKLNVYDKTLMLKTYVISILQYCMRAFPLPKLYERKINSILYPFIWNSKREKLARNIINLPYDRGGLNMTDINLRSVANIIQIISKVEQKSEQPWAALYIYWLGLTLKPLYPKISENKYVHTFQVPSHMQYIKDLIHKYKSNNILWNINPKLIYKQLINESNIKPKIMKLYPQVNWPAIWCCINTEKYPDKKTFLFKYIHGILPTGDMLLKYHIINEIPLCYLCKKGRFTFQHLFYKCTYFDVDFLAEMITEQDNTIIFDETLIRCGINRLDNFSADKDVIQIVYEHLYHVWYTYNSRLKR